MTHMSPDDVILYVDRDMDELAQRRAENHLATCQACADRVTRARSSEATLAETKTIKRAMSSALDTRHPSSAMRLPRALLTAAPTRATAARRWAAAAAVCLAGGAAAFALLSDERTTPDARHADAIASAPTPPTSTAQAPAAPSPSPTRHTSTPASPVTDKANKADSGNKADATTLNPVGPLPKPWIPYVSGAYAYTTGTTRARSTTGDQGFVIASQEARPDGFGSIQQSFLAERYRDTRLSLSADVATVGIDDAKAWGGLWMRIDDSNGHVLAFDNMQDRPRNGTTDWARMSVVLDVPNNAHRIVVGALLVGAGQLYFDGVSIDTVSRDVPTTSLTTPSNAKTPSNLDP